MGISADGDGAVEGKVILWGVVAASLWGTSYVAAKFSVQWVPPFTAAAFRFLVVAAVLWAVLPLRAERPKVERRDWPILALAGLFQTSFYFALQYAGIGLTSASNTAIIVNTRPIFVALMSALVLREVLGSRKIGGILMAFVGVVLVSTGGSLSGLGLEREQLMGDTLILLNALSGAVGLVLTKKVLSRFRPYEALLLVQTFGALGLLPFAALEIGQWGSLQSTPVSVWLVLIYQGLFCSIAPHLLWNNVLARIEASRAAVFMYITPLMAVLLSYLFLGERFSWIFLVGAVLVVSGAYLTVSSEEGRTRS